MSDTLQLVVDVPNIKATRNCATECPIYFSLSLSYGALKPGGIWRCTRESGTDCLPTA
jgi:hypothetical protein